ncbi:hypothetical protein [Massilia genomosp. 1]|uniref:Uncharacterized protein n=1 Tax=Massilia genomosp. 1 TaxID=2609280 RepID=A0ABX0MTF0_9BURK|nr:hypothetical protein [Massilia genomosp. 1]NHZ66031.1 hypothetical protein [Massilia genomosp. 1]
MTYLLATIGTKVQWYVVDTTRHGGLSAFTKGDYDLVDTLDLEVVLGFGDKVTAKNVAMAIGLTTWRYVKMDSPKKV